MNFLFCFLFFSTSSSSQGLLSFLSLNCGLITDLWLLYSFHNMFSLITLRELKDPLNHLLSVFIFMEFGLYLVVLGELNVMPGIELVSASCKASFLTPCTISPALSTIMFIKKVRLCLNVGLSLYSIQISVPMCGFLFSLSPFKAIFQHLLSDLQFNLILTLLGDCINFHRLRTHSL